MNALVEANGLKKCYDGRAVVDGVDLVVSPGEVVAIIGPNGAGKSTTLEMVLGLRRPDAGEVKYWTADPRRSIGAQLQATPFFPGLSTVENLNLFAAFYGVGLSRERTAELLEACGLTAVARTEASRLSGGQQKRLAIVLTLVHQPELVFLDEPTAALDPRARHQVRTMIRQLASRGTAVVFTSHDMEEVSKLASKVVLIDRGRVRASGAPKDLIAQNSAVGLEQLYLTLTEEVH